METSIEIPIKDCDLKVSVGRDGVWLHFGDNAMIHVHNVLGSGRGIIESNIDKWCLERQKQAEAI